MSSRSVFNSLERKIPSLLLILLCALNGQAEDDLGDKIRAQVCRVFDERKDATVRVEAYDRHGKLCGTGFFADPAGTVYTLASIVANAEDIFIIHGERKIPAKLLMADPRSGIALIKADINSPFIPVGDARKLVLMSPVIAIGFPVNLDETAALGTVAGFDRKFLGRYFMTTHIRAILPVEPGFGGAPLLNLRGEVVGIIFSGIGMGEGGGGCYAMPINAAEKIRMDYVRFGEARHGWVGVTVEEQAEPTEGSRVKVVDLGPDTPAAKSGLKDGDILLQVDQTKITTTEDVIDAAYFLTAGDTVKISVIRDGQPLSLDVRSTIHPVQDSPNYPQSAGYPQNGMQELHALIPDTGSNIKLE